MRPEHVDDVFKNYYTYSASQPPLIFFWRFFPNGSEFLVQILHAYYAFPSTLDSNFYSFTCNFDEDMPYWVRPPFSQNVHRRLKRTLGGRT